MWLELERAYREFSKVFEEDKVKRFNIIFSIIQGLQFMLKSSIYTNAWKTRMLKLTKIFFENFWGPISQLSEIVWPASYFQHPSQFWKYKLYPLREKIVKTMLASNHFVTSSVEWPISKLWSRWNENSMPILWSHKLKS